MPTIKDILLDDKVSAWEGGLDSLVVKIEQYVRVHEDEVLAKELLESAWTLQSKLYALRGPKA